MYISVGDSPCLSLTSQHSHTTMITPPHHEKERSQLDMAYENLKRNIKPCSIFRNPGMSMNDYDTATAYARGRVLGILQNNRYRTIVPGKYLPAFDLIHYCELVPYTVDLYALQYHKESSKVVTDELIIDIRRAKYDGLTIIPYEMSIPPNHDPLKERIERGKAFVEHANQYKKQMICSHYNIDPKRYIILNEEELFSKNKAKSAEDIEKILFVDKCDTTAKAKDDLFVELPA